MSCCKYHADRTCEKMHECDRCEVQTEWKENERREFEEMMQKTTRNINVGYLSALFDTAIEYISKIAVDDRISEPIHKAINPMLDDMIGQLHSMKNNTMATMMFEGGGETKVVQPVKCNHDCGIYPCIGELCKHWKSTDAPMGCDEGRICPKCGKAMIRCKVTIQGKDEKTRYENWVCDGCGYKGRI